MTDSKLIRGMASAFAGAVLWGFSGTCMQFLLERYEISSLFITMGRDIGAGLLFLILFLTRYREQCSRMLADGRTVKRLIAFGFLGLFLCQLTYVLAIEYTNAGTATVLQSLNVIIVLVITCIKVRRGPYRTEVVAIICALVATVLVATKGDLGRLNISGLGLFWGLSTAAAGAFYTLYPRKLFKRWDSFTVTGFGIIGAAVAASVTWLALGLAHTLTGGAIGSPAVVPNLDLTGIVVLAVIACVGTFLTFALFMNGVALIGGVKGSLVGTAEPVSATVFSALWIGTHFMWADWLGLALIVATVALVALQPQAPESPSS